MNENHKGIALQLALDGCNEAQIIASLMHEHYLGHAASCQLAAYALRGETPSNYHSTGSDLDLSTVHTKRKVDSVESTLPRKAKVRKTMIMLKVNYKEAGEDAVTDCLTDLQHYCMAKGIDYLTCEERAQGHFVTEATGGDNA